MKDILQAPLPDKETARLKALEEYNILDTAPEKEFDDVTQLAAAICNTPIALVTLIDANRQWFKSRVGLEVSQTSRELAFCAYTILQTNILIVPNTLADERFATNLLVTSDPKIRFYAGVPLITAENHALGTLCVIDQVPRELNSQQIEALEALGRQVVQQIELRRNVAKLESTPIKRQQTQKKQEQFFKKVAIGLGLASAVLVSLSIVSYRNLSNLVHNRNSQIQDYKVLENLKDIRTNIQKASLAKHRYLTTGQAQYLKPYDDVAEEIKLEIAQLRQAIANKHEQQHRLATLSSLITMKLTEIEEIINLNKTGGFNTSSRLLLVQNGKQLMDDIEAQLQEMERAENKLITQQSQAAKTNANNTIFAFSSGIILNFLILGLVYYFIDREIRQRQQTEFALEQERDFTFAVLDTVASLVVVVDAQGKIIRFNRACEQTTGYWFDEVRGKYFWDLFLTTEEVVEVKAILQKILAGQLSNQYETYLPARDETKRLIAWENTTLRDKKGAVEYIIASGIDITESKQTLEALRASEEQYRDLFENASDLIHSATLDGHFIYVNHAWRETLEYTEAEIINLSVFDIIHPNSQAYYKQILERVISGEKITDIQTAFITQSGKQILVEGTFSCKFVDGKPVAIQGIFHNITQRKQAESAQQQANEQLSRWVNELEQRNREITLLSELSDVLQACLKTEEAYTAIASYVQPLFPEASGGLFLINPSKSLVEAVANWGSTPLTSEKLFTPNDCWALRRGKAHLVKDTDNGLLCKHLHHALPAESLCVPMMAQGEALGVLYLSAVKLGQFTAAKQQLATTVAEHIALALANLKLRETLHNQSTRDPLTGLFNRRYMEESLEREIQRCDRQQQPLSIAMIDIDHFKRFNDSFGHEAGDTVLRELSQFLQRYVRGSDIACRYGGEEFTLILPEASLDVTHKRADKLREGIKHLNLEHRYYALGALTLSIGVASFPEHGLCAEAVVRAADAALYRAKKEGRDTVRLAS